MSRDLVISVEENLLAEATSKAASEHQSIDQLMQQWLADYVARQNRVERYRELMKRLDHVRAPAEKISRDEMNER
ncbi:MAG: hypothetical protein ACREFE_18995 [Limisphaerales bacterium]